MMNSYLGLALAIVFIGFGGILAVVYPFIARRQYRRAGIRASPGVILRVVLDTVWAYWLAFGSILFGMFVWDQEGPRTFAAILAALPVWVVPVSFIVAQLAFLANHAVQALIARRDADSAPR